MTRRTVLNEMRTIENVVRAVLREADLKLGTPSRKDFVARAHDLIAGVEGLRRTIEPLLEILATMLRAFAKLQTSAGQPTISNRQADRATVLADARATPMLTSAATSLWRSASLGPKIRRSGEHF